MEKVEVYVDFECIQNREMVIELWIDSRPHGVGSGKNLGNSQLSFVT